MTLQGKDALRTYVTGSHVRRVTLGFIVSRRACEASWGGFYGLGESDGWFDASAVDRAARAAGAEPIISFGGAAESGAGAHVHDVGSLAAQYQAVIDRYGVRDLDFDIEGADQADSASLERRFKAIAQVQRRAPRPGQAGAGVADPAGDADAV